ncbi:MAG: undecaprenyl-diphosphatase [Sulfurospirillum sp.]
MQTLNQAIFLNINDYASKNHFLDSLMVLAAKGMPFVFIGVLFYLWFSNRKNEALYAGYATSLGVGINQLIGIFYFHNRPFMDHLGTTLLSHKAENSFPSDHTTFTVSIALMLLTFKPTRSLGIVATFLALWCGIARVYTGVHYPFDILGSIIVSIIAVVAVSLLESKLSRLNLLVISAWDKIFKKKNEKTF